MPDAPEVSAGSLPADAPLLGMAPTRDVRSEERAGMIGALKVAVGSDLASYVDASLRRILIERGYRVVAAPDPRELVGGQRSVFDARIVAVDVETAHISSADAILDPARSSVTLVARVYDEQGSRIYQESHVGRSVQTIGMTWKGKGIGRAIGGAAERAVYLLVYDSEFEDAIR
jgi:hypothetical protein